MKSEIQFYSEEIEFQLDKEDSVKSWILFVVQEAGKSVEEINYIFCSDEHVLALNKQHLDHDYYTDILTFPYAPSEASFLQADIYISIDRVSDNAQQLNNSFLDELHRVMIHGVLHLLGHDDHGEAAQQAMRDKEDQALGARTFV